MCVYSPFFSHIQIDKSSFSVTVTSLLFQYHCFLYKGGFSVRLHLFTYKHTHTHTNTFICNTWYVSNVNRIFIYVILFMLMRMFQLSYVCMGKTRILKRTDISNEDGKSSTCHTIKCKMTNICATIIIFIIVIVTISTTLCVTFFWFLFGLLLLHQHDYCCYMESICI